jgi:hypothetical protein
MFSHHEERFAFSRPNGAVELCGDNGSRGITCDGHAQVAMCNTFVDRRSVASEWRRNGPANSAWTSRGFVQKCIPSIPSGGDIVNQALDVLGEPTLHLGVFLPS